MPWNIVAPQDGAYIQPEAATYLKVIPTTSSKINLGSRRVLYGQIASFQSFIDAPGRVEKLTPQSSETNYGTWISKATVTWDVNLYQIILASDLPKPISCTIKLEFIKVDPSIPDYPSMGVNFAPSITIIETGITAVKATFNEGTPLTFTKRTVLYPWGTVAYEYFDLSIQPLEPGTYNLLIEAERAGTWWTPIYQADFTILSPGEQPPPPPPIPVFSLILPVLVLAAIGVVALKVIK